MTSSEFRAALAQLGWNAAQLAALLGCERTLVHAWSIGRARVPPALVPWLRGCVGCLRRHPVPRWRVRKPGGGRRRAGARHCPECGCGLELLIVAGLERQWGCPECDYKRAGGPVRAGDLVLGEASISRGSVSRDETGLGHDDVAEVPEHDDGDDGVVGVGADDDGIEPQTTR